MIDTKAVIREIEAGLNNEADRLATAMLNLDFYRGDFDAYLSYPEDGDYEAPRRKRTSLIMQEVIYTLTAHLYAKGPAREFPDDAPLTDWLNHQYQREGVDGLLQEADRLALAARVCAIQVVGPNEDEDPVDAADRLVRFQLWPADQFCVWVDPARPNEAAVVATIDQYDHQRRLRLWTTDTIYTFATDKLADGQTSGGTAYRLLKDEENYYGALPFAFIHANPPATDFWNHAPGDVLREVNDYLNHDLTDSGESLRYARMPILSEFGNNSEPPKPIAPGKRWKLNPTSFDAASNGIPPRLEYLQPDLGFVDAGWMDANNYIDHTLQMVGCPPSTIRLAGDPAKSGYAILMEQQPLVTRAKARQRPFATYEKQLARATLIVGGAEYDRLRSTPPAKLDPKQADRLTLRWPNMTPEVPLTGEEQAAQDATDLAMGLTSIVKIVMRRFSMSRAEALDYLKSVGDDRDELAVLRILPDPQPKAVATAINRQDSTDARNQADLEPAAESDSQPADD